MYDIQGIFNVKSKTRILQVKNRLNNFRKERRSIEEYVSKLTRFAEEVQEAGVALDDGELTLIALNNLDLLYDAFVTAYTARVDDISFAACSKGGFRHTRLARQDWFGPKSR